MASLRSALTLVHWTGLLVMSLKLAKFYEFYFNCVLKDQHNIYQVNNPVNPDESHVEVGSERAAIPITFSGRQLDEKARTSFG